MTISTTTKKVTGSGNGSATSFSFSPFTVFAKGDLLVVKVSSAGVETTLTEGTGTTNYSVTLTTPNSLPSTGSITYPATLGTQLASGEKIVIKRVVDLLQDIDLFNQGGFYPDVIEGGLDTSMMIDLQQQEDISRSLKGPITDTVSVEIPSQTARANKFLTFNGSGVPTVSAGSTGGVPVSTFMATVLDDTSAAAARTTLGAAGTTAASTSAAGIVELATTGETTTGTATDRAVTPDGLKDMTSLAGAAWFLDEDAMGTNSATKVASQQSVKAYVTSSVAAVALPRVLLVNTEITGTPSALTFEDADGMNWSTYKYFEFELSSFVSVAMNILVQMSQGGSYETGGTDYAYGSAGVTFTAGSDHDHSSINCPHAAEIYKGSGGYDEGFALSGTLHLNITDGTDKMGPFFHWSLGGNVASGGYAGAASGTGWLRNGVSTAIDGIKFSCSSGNLVDGHFRVWGIK
tara:strand:- start:2597 stop:3982 length:1386 start_codon:yes stop_codon:yes gene_type:complete